MGLLSKDRGESMETLDDALRAGEPVCRQKGGVQATPCRMRRHERRGHGGMRLAETRRLRRR
jgi:hypothetical protein